MEETAIHLITECPGYARLRIATLGRQGGIVEEEREFPIYKILEKEQEGGRLESQTKKGGVEEKNKE